MCYVEQVAAISIAEQVRQYAAKHWVEPARRRGIEHCEITAGVVHKALGLTNRVPGVCQALSSQIFLRQNRLALMARTGPPGGQSTTVVFSYRLLPRERRTPSAPKDSPSLWDLYGVGAADFARAGGGEAFLRQERRSWNPPAPRRTHKSR